MMLGIKITNQIVECLLLSFLLMRKKLIAKNNKHKTNFERLMLNLLVLFSIFKMCSLLRLVGVFRSICFQNYIYAQTNWRICFGKFKKICNLPIFFKRDLSDIGNHICNLVFSKL